MNYAVRFLFGDVPRLRCGAVFLTVAALGIFVSGCNKSQAASGTPMPEVEVATVEQRDVPVCSEWVATLDGYVNAQIRPQVSGADQQPWDPSIKALTAFPSVLGYMDKHLSWTSSLATLTTTRSKT